VSAEKEGEEEGLYRCRGDRGRCAIDVEFFMSATCHLHAKSPMGMILPRRFHVADSDRGPTEGPPQVSCQLELVVRFWTVLDGIISTRFFKS
jgi:hypothetical protein